MPSKHGNVAPAGVERSTMYILLIRDTPLGKAYVLNVFSLRESRL